MLFEALLKRGHFPKKGGVPERSNGAGCKPVDFGLRKFESFPLHQLKALVIKSAISLDIAGVVQW